MSVGGVHVVVVVAALAAAVATGCATPVTMKSAAPYAHLVVDGADHGAIDEQGKALEVPAGAAPVAWQLLDEKKEVLAEGVVERSEVRWEVVAPAIAAAACCIPSMAVAGCCAANPALLGGAIGCALGNIGGLVAVFQAPGWLTIPAGCVGAAAGASPLALGIIGAAPPTTVELTPSTSTSPPPEQAPAPPTTAGLGVPW